MLATRAQNRTIAALPTVLAVALLGAAATWFATRWHTVMGEGPPPEIAWGWLGLAALLLVVHAGSAMLIWRQMLAAVGSQVTWREAADSFAPSLLARYVPGKVWANAVRIALAQRAGVQVGAGAGAIVWETLVALGSAGLVALVGLHGQGDSVRVAGWLLAGVLSIWVLAALGSRHPRGAMLLHRVGGTNPVRAPRALAPSIITSVIGWGLFGVAHLAVARAVAPMSPADLPVVAGAVALAWAGGYLAIVMPLGLGVRDGLLMVLLAPLLTAPQALLFVALSRLVQLAVDASLTGAWLLRQGTRRAFAARPPSA